MSDVDFLHLTVPQSARNINTRDNLGFCMESERLAVRLDLVCQIV